VTPLTVTPLTVTPLTVTPLTVTPLTVTPLTVSASTMPVMSTFPSASTSTTEVLSRSAAAVGSMAAASKNAVCSWERVDTPEASRPARSNLRMAPRMAGSGWEVARVPATSARVWRPSSSGITARSAGPPIRNESFSVSRKTFSSAVITGTR